MSGIHDAARRVLEEGRFCYLSARTPGGIHVTPVVFVLDGGRVWGTTTRRSVKAGVWAREPRTAGLVVHEGTAISFRGSVTMHDALDPTTWGVSILRAPAVLKASTMFTLKNMAFFAGYARDAYRVPLAWTPPGRVFFSVDLDAGAVLDVESGTVEERWGRWGSRVRGRTTFGSVRRRSMPDDGVPAEIKDLVAEPGTGTVALEGASGPVVLPVAWVRVPAEGSYYAVLPRPFLALAGAPARGPASLVVDHASRWRAARMAGVLLEGVGETFVPRQLTRGRSPLLERAARAGPLPADPAVVRLVPEVAVWWKGWTSGTVSSASP